MKQRRARTRIQILVMALVLAAGTLVTFSSPVQAATGNILPPFDIGQTWNICRGYGYASHTGTSNYGLDLTGSGCDAHSATGRSVRAPMSGTVYYYQAVYGNLCVNTHDGRSYTLTHINSSVTSGTVSAGQLVGSVAAPGQRGNNNVAHIHFQMWPTHGCYNGPGVPFDSAHNARICGAPDLTSSGPSVGNGVWSGTSFTGQSCGSVPLRSALTAARNADGRLEVFAIGTDGNIYSKSQVTPNSAFRSDWNTIPAGARDVAATLSRDGRIELFHIGNDGAVWLRWQTCPNCNFGSEISLGGYVQSAIAATRNADGRVEVFVVGTDGNIYSKPQQTPNGPFIPGWHALPASAVDVAAEVSIDGRIELFHVGNDRALWTRAQTCPNCSFGSEHYLGGSLR